MDQIEEKLRSRLKELTNRAVEIDRSLRQEEGALSRDWEEQAGDLEDAEVLAALDTRTREEIQQARAALARIADGTYGTCRVCGGRIPRGRLAALPYTTVCVECAAASSVRP